MKPVLQEIDFETAAAVLGCQVAAIKAVCEIEAPKGGFNTDDSPVTLFEGQYFHKFTGGKYDVQFPNISYPRWDRSKYGRNWAQEQARLKSAMSLDREAGIKAASWGKFQIMGFNYAVCGFATVEDFYTQMQTSEGAHLQAFIGFVRSQKLDVMIREGRWHDFAVKYNGPLQHENQYSKRLQAAFYRNGGHL